EHQRHEQTPGGLLHSEGPPGCCGNRDSRFSLALRPEHFHSYLPSSRGHQPEFADEVLRVGLRSFHPIRRWSVLRAFPHSAERHDANVGYVSVKRAHFDLRDSRNHRWCSHGDKEPVRPGFAFIENVRAAYVRATTGHHKETTTQEDQEGTLHRLTRRIQLPQASPTRVMTRAAAKATSIPTQNPVRDFS